MYKIKFKDGLEKEFKSLKGANLCRADLRRADLYGADLVGAILRGADLRGADLRGAYLYGADLRGADLVGADLRRADLYGADLFNTNIISFQLGKHFGFYHEGMVKIGCKSDSLENWLKDFEEVGKKEDYSDQEIKLYGLQLKLLQLAEKNNLVNKRR